MSTSPNTVIELRRYTLHPGHRDTLIELFEAEFIEPQEAVGMTVLAQFRDEDHPDTFTWFRGFADMTGRQSALAAFYGGPSWAQHRDAANATMIDSDNVLLLTPVLGHLFPVVERRETTPCQFEVTTFHLAGPATTDQAAALGRTVGTDRMVALLTTLVAENTFPALPVREGEHVIVAITSGGAPENNTWAELGLSELGLELIRTSTFRMAPTTRSRLR